VKRERKPSQRLTRQQVLVTLGLAVLVMVIGGYIFGWEGERPVDNTGFPKKTLWDWLELLVVPAVIAVVGIVGGAWFTRERAQDTALQMYLDKMSELLIDKGLRRETGRYGDTRVTARARTLAILSQLDGGRKRIVLQFLREARLINKDHTILEGVTINPCIVGLRGADLRNAKLQDMRLISSDRTEAVSLEGAILREANLRNVDLEGADLREADLRGADLQGAYLKSADLSGVNLAKATLKCADLRRAKFGIYTRKDKRNKQILKRAADLSRADLRGADLSGAIELMEDGQEQEITRQWLDERTHLLTGATMPDGTVHP
jgi:uncharacterized protein YjbI with pentapeptide repeats